MSAAKAGPAVPNWLAAGILGVILGGVGGFYGARWGEKPPMGGSPPGGGAMAGGGAPSPGGGGMGGGGGAQEHPNAAALVRTVGNLAILEKARGHELSNDQRQKLASVAGELSASDTLTEAQCEAQIAKINGVLTPEQKTVLEDLTPRFGRGGGAGGRMGGPGNPGGPPGGGNGPAGGNSPGGTLAPAAMGGMPGGMGGMGGGARTDWERPFKVGRGRDRLDELTGLLKK